MNTYPAFYKAVDGKEYLYLDKNNYFSFERGIWGKSDSCDNHEKDTNITREYLADNAIKIESQEHLDFLYEIAGVHKLNIGPVECRIFDSNYPYFVNIRNDVFHVSENQAKLEGKTLITIPLPPKEHEEDSMKQLERKLSAAMSTLEHLGYTYHGGELWKPPIAEAIKEPEPKEWPQVGDEVVWGVGGVVGEVVFIHGLDALIKTENNKFLIPVLKLSKPQSALEEELSKELEKMVYDGMDNSYDLNHNCYYLVSGLMKKYDIKKKPE